MSKLQLTLNNRLLKNLWVLALNLLVINVLAISLSGLSRADAKQLNIGKGIENDNRESESRNIEELNFQVLLDGSEIGFHHFRVEQTSNTQIIDINANFKVTFLGIPFYRYTHTNQEMWRDGCLQSIRSSTNDNGDQFTVDGSRNSSGFSIGSGKDQQNLESACVMTFAYWNKNFLKQPQLLNSQNGEWLPVDIDFIGIEGIRLKNQTLAAEKYRIRNKDKEIDITVWYDNVTNQWLSLESRVSGDRLLRYVLTTAMAETEA